ncbi:hypothetical protein [Aeoliella mucimassa]|nr:hypothetical protein [Aeoliella mucimassa]
MADKPTVVEDSHRESLVAFLEFAVEAVGVAQSQEGDLVTLEFNHREHPAWPRPYQVRVSVATDSADLPRRVVPATEGIAWLWKLAQLERGALLARPASQPEAVHEITRALFEAYQVDGGQMHLAGCRINEVPFLRVTELATDDPAQVVHRFYNAEMQPVSDDEVASLGLAEVVPLGNHPTSFTRSAVHVLVNQIEEAMPGVVAATVVIAKRAEGAIQFEIGEQCAQVSFNDWTRSLSAPPFRCAASGRETFHLAALEDGRIVAAEAIAECEHTGTRVLDSELVTCTSTGKRVDPEITSRCAVSDSVLLTDEMATCKTCGQQVSPAVLDAGSCQACRELPLARATDELIAPLLERYPRLQQYGKFRAGQCGGVLRVMAHGWWRRLLLAVPSDESQPMHLAMRQGLAGGWEQVPEADWPQLLGQPSDGATE